jgi:cytochrome c oxidase subunit 4
MTEKIISDKTYLAILFALLLLTLLTYWLAQVDLGRWNSPIGLAIAAVKASLVILFFMHARYSTWLTWVVIVAGLLWFSILFVLTLSDYLTRSW